jgi:hypothetical protein
MTFKNEFTGNRANSCPKAEVMVMVGESGLGDETKKVTNPKIPSKKRIDPEISA